MFAKLDGRPRSVGSTPFYLLIVIAGVSLSSLHQSSLGTLLLLLPTKVHPLWHSELLPVFFLLSAIMAGPAVMLVEHTLATHFLAPHSPAWRRCEASREA